ncbi:MAG: hypothetical protein U0414_09875 [Polyangiaceae bacterium]
MSARRRGAATLFALGLLLGCRSADPVGEAKQVATQVVDDGRRAVASAIMTATAVASELQGSAQKMFTGLSADGKLSDVGRSLVASAAKTSGIEQTVAKGAQLAPAAWEVAKVINGAVDDQTVLEPIVEKADDPAAVDAAIGGMPRVEVFDGVHVGFRKLDDLTVDKSVKERAFLVLWRRDDKLVGFLYRSHREIDLDALVKAAPRLVALFNGSLPSG